MFTAVLVSVLCGLAHVTGSPIRKRDFLDPEPCSGNCSWIHDPNIIKKDSTYYRFSTSGNIAIATAPSLSGPWDYKGAMLPNGPKTTIGYNGPNNIDVWAPDVTKVGNQYYAFYAVSAMGYKDSEIGVASSSTLDPGSWTDHGSLYLPHGDYNLIDPNLFITDQGSLNLVFGSYWTGIQRIELSSPPVEHSGQGTPQNIIQNSTASPEVVEGAFQFKWNTQGKDWYYVFFSSGNCCAAPPNLPPPGGEYKIMACRGESPQGPFFDQNNQNCLQSGGTVVLGSHGDIYAPGGQGVINDGGRAVLYYHYVRPSVGYRSDQFFFGMNYLDFGSGWPVVVKK